MVCINFPFYFQVFNFVCGGGGTLEDRLGPRTSSMAGSDFTYWSILLTLYINLKTSHCHANSFRLKKLLWARLNQLFGVVGYCSGTQAKGQLFVFLVVLRFQGEGAHHWRCDFTAVWAENPPPEQVSCSYWTSLQMSLTHMHLFQMLSDASRSQNDKGYNTSKGLFLAREEAEWWVLTSILKSVL